MRLDAKKDHYDDLDTNLANNDKTPEQTSPDVDVNKLSPEEVKKMDAGKLTIPDIKVQRAELKRVATIQLDQYIKPDKEGATLINLEEYKALKGELDNTESPQYLEDLVRKLKAVPKSKEDKESAEKDKEKPLPLDSPELKTKSKDFNKICDDNQHLIGEGQVAGFKEWFKQELQKKPTVKNAEDIIKKLEGKNSTDKDGLYPRRKVFNELQALYKENDAGSPLDNKYIKHQGLSERKAFLKNATDLKKHLRTVKDTEFYTPQAVKGIMKESLSADSPAKQKDMLLDAKKTSEQEAQAFVKFREKMVVGGVTVRKMSQKSVDTITGYYKTVTNLKDRLALSTHWPAAVESESKKVSVLFELYRSKGMLDEFKLAVGSFEELDFMEKDKALKQHEQEIKGAKSKEKLQESLTIKAAHAKIDEAGRKKIMSKDTQKKFKTWFNSDDAKKDPKTGEKKGIEGLKTNYDILISAKPSADYKNIEAYKIKRDRFTKELKIFGIDNPDITDSELQKWQERYDKEGWTDRKKVYKDLKAKELSLEKDRKKASKIESETGEEASKEQSEKAPEVKKTIEAAQNLMNEGQNEDAYAILAEQWINQRNNLSDQDKTELEFWMQVSKDRMDKFGRGENSEDEASKEIEREISNVASNDSEIKDEIDEAGLYNLNLEGTEQSENRHQQTQSAQDRAKKESLNSASNDDLERDLIEDYYEQTDSEHFLNKDQTGEQIQDINLNGAKLSKEDKSSLRDTTREHSSQLIDKTGFTHVNFKDKSGKNISSEQAKSLQEATLLSLEDKLAKKAIKKTQAKGAPTKNASNVYDLSARIAAKRAAHKKIKEEINDKERLRRAA